MKALMYLACLVAGLVCPKLAHAQETFQFPVFLGLDTAPGDLKNAKPRSVRFVTTLDFPPFNYLGQDGKLNGFNVYLAKSICAELGIEAACTIQAVPFEELPLTLARGQADAIVSGFAANAETRKTFLFSNAYLQLPARFVGLRKSAEPDFKTGLKGSKVGVVAGSAHEAMARAFFAFAEVIGYASRDLLLDEVRLGKVDLAFGDAMTLSFWLNGTNASGCCRFINGAYYSPIHLGEGMRIAVPVTRPDLVAAFNQSLRELQKDGRIEELYLRFFPNGFY